MNFKKLDIDWSFPNADTKYATHGMHKYPARMPPQIPDTIINHLKESDILSEDSVIYDPFLGSGTTVVEARLKNINSIGNDINPFACMLAKSKSTKLNDKLLKKAWTTHKDNINNNLINIKEKYNNSKNIDLYIDDIRDGWFPELQLYQLLSIKNYIDNILLQEYNTDICRIFRISLAETTREVSYQRNGEFKRYRMSKEDRKDHNPNVWNTYKKSIENNIDSIIEFSQRVSDNNYTKIYNRDSRNIDFISKNSIDTIITSPPYGDHSTTVAYGQFSQDPAIISNGEGYDKMRNVDKKGLGGNNNIEELNELKNVSNSLNDTIIQLEKIDGRKIDAINFFEDYYQVLKECKKVLKPNKPLIIVVANRTMSRVNIPTHIITKELCENIGFEFIENIPREIPNKTMPLKNAPENIEGLNGELMSDENILILNNN